ncbi:MAG: hypothetical protein PCFJNLEI_02236 [Verrucomicrobiae bacterium]|nr:hypothetical protein [Verrucomicrobiae bacterium]
MANETQRIQKTYQEYRESAAAQSRWSIANPGNRWIEEERARRVAALWAAPRSPAAGERRVLEIGCGAGGVLGGLIPLGARPENLYGVDLVPERIAAAQVAYPRIHFQAGNAEQLEFAPGMFDWVLVFTVFSSILDPQMARNVAGEVRRVLKPGGVVLWYDFRYNNPQNPNVRGMKLGRIRELFPDFALELRSITLLPPLSRRLNGLLPVLYPVLSWLPPLRTHYLGLMTRTK